MLPDCPRDPRDVWESGLSCLCHDLGQDASLPEFFENVKSSDDLGLIVIWSRAHKPQNYLLSKSHQICGQLVNNYSTTARWIWDDSAELAIIISYPTSASRIIVSLKTPPKYRKVDTNRNKNAPKSRVHLPYLLGMVYLTTIHRSGGG